MRNHDNLINTLTSTAKPVARVRPTAWRVAGWVAGVLPCGALSSWALHSRYTDWTAPGALPALFTLALSFIVAIYAIAGAFTLSLAGRPPVNLKGGAVLAALWLVINLLNMSASAPPVGAGGLREGIHCYLFMLAAGFPMLVITVISLRRTRSLHPGQTLALSGCAIAFMSSLLLSLCHETHLHQVDFMMHLAAGVTIVLVTIVTGRRWVRLDR